MIISICIPTYNEPQKVKKLLDAVFSQTCRDYEVIITDDSTNNLTETLIAEEFSHLPLRYIKNKVSLGTPENWNFAISLAKGDWIKLMHHDDWFYDEHSLQAFAEAAAGAEADQKFIYCAFQNVYLSSGQTEKVVSSNSSRWLLRKSPLVLFQKNIIGNPSCTLVKREIASAILFDKKLKWIVDFECYIRIFDVAPNWLFIKKVLVNVGNHDKQVTSYARLNPVIEIPEAVYFLECHGAKTMNNIFVYDYYWRLIRNLNIRSEEQFNRYLNEPCNFHALNNIIKFQTRINIRMLKIGVFSKLFMCISFIGNLVTKKST
ncbi:MAG: glycosyltransferase [Bacteroidetes bacterium]|nr:glycosyltransferase [Bacteroidota bacterium]